MLMLISSVPLAAVWMFLLTSLAELETTFTWADVSSALWLIWLAVAVSDS